jgi:hypothetical protein
MQSDIMFRQVRFARTLCYLTFNIENQRRTTVISGGWYLIEDNGHSTRMDRSGNGSVSLFRW